MDCDTKGQTVDSDRSGYPDSWYVATANGLKDRPPLEESLTADVCVIGAAQDCAALMGAGLPPRPPAPWPLAAVSIRLMRSRVE